jgi:hypothetical protein
MKEPEQGFRPWEYEKKSVTDVMLVDVGNPRHFLSLWQFLKRTKRGWLQMISKRGMKN